MSTQNTEEELYGTPRVGGDALSYCTRCKMELAHVIVSMVRSRPAKVICKTCKSQHNYKRGNVSDLVRASHPTRPRKVAAEKTFVKVSEMWEKKMAEVKNVPVRPYSVQTTFAKGDVIQHPMFGVGLVEEVRGAAKITVLFRNDEKTLVHGMAKPG